MDRGRYEKGNWRLNYNRTHINNLRIKENFEISGTISI